MADQSERISRLKIDRDTAPQSGPNWLLPGVVLALITRLVLKEPARGSADDVEPVRDVVAYLARLPSMRHHLLACSLHTLTLSATATFKPARAR